MYNDDNEIRQIAENAENKEVVVRPRSRRSKYVSRRLFAFSLAVCVMASSAAGYVGGRLGVSKDTNYAVAADSGYNGATVRQLSATTPSSQELTISEIAAKASASVVEITTESIVRGSMMRQYISEGAGSGVIITDDGYIITNNHVIDGARKITVRLNDGTVYDAQLIATDSKTDVAVIKVEAEGLTPAEIGDSDELIVGETAVAIGNPLGELGGTVTNGIISALDREINIDGETMNLLQTNAAINPGNSGGGLFNGNGELIGLVVAKSSGEDVEGLGFAIPINDVSEVVSQLIDYGYVRGRVATGMSLLDVNDVRTALLYGVSETGVYITQVDSSSSAYAAGLRAGDRIVAVDGAEVSTADEVSNALNGYSVGDTVALTIYRSGGLYSVDVMLQEAAPSGAVSAA